MSRIASALFACLLIVGCDSSGSTFDIDPYVGVYTGEVRTVAFVGANEETEGISVTITADESEQVVTFNLQRESGFSSALLGSYSRRGIEVDLSASRANGRFTVSADGEIEGTFGVSGGTVGPRGAISGMLTPTSFLLVYSEQEEGEGVTEIHASR